MSIEQEGFRWRNDDGSETTATWKANQDTNGVSVGLDTAVRLRVIVNAAGLAPETSLYRLEARRLASPTGNWFEVEPTASPGGSPLIRLKPSANITAGGENTTAQLTSPAGSPKSFVSGRMWDDESGQDSVALANDQYTELEFCVEAVAANGAVAGDVYEFRVTRKGFVEQGGGGTLTRTDLLNTKILSANGFDLPLTGTSGAFNPPDNSVLFVVLAINCETNAQGDTFGTATTMSDSINGTTGWTRVSTLLIETDDFFEHLLEVWRRDIVTGASMTVTPSNPTADSFTVSVPRIAMQIFAYEDVNATPVGATASDSTLSDPTGAMTLSGTPAASSHVIAARTLYMDDTADTTATPDTGGGFSEIYDNAASAGDPGFLTLQTQIRTGSTSTGVEWDDINDDNRVVRSSMGTAFEIQVS